VHNGTREISDVEALALLEEVRAAGDMSGLGACCAPSAATGVKVLCLKFWEAVCRRPMSTVVQSVDNVLRRHGLADVRVGVNVILKGEAGPRCQPTESVLWPPSRLGRRPIAGSANRLRSRTRPRR
jgi:hypothetical protein